MSRFDYECEVCGKEEKTICYGAVRLCKQCLKEKIGDTDVEEITKKREYNDLDDCARECGNYYNLINLLYCVGNLTGTDMGHIVENLDDIFDDLLI